LKPRNCEAEPVAAPKKHTDSENPEKSSVKEKPPASDEKLSDEGRQAAFSKPKAKAETAKPKDKAETVPAVSDKDKPQERAAKQMKADKAAFVYTDKDGKPTSDSKSADKTKPVVAVVGDKQGRLTAKYHFSDHKAVEERRPSTVERYEYKVSSKDQTVEIKQQLVDLTQPQEVVAATVKTTRKLTDSSVSVQMSLANGIEQKAGFDGQGRGRQLCVCDERRQRPVGITQRPGAAGQGSGIGCSSRDGGRSGIAPGLCRAQC
jgi:hypothetical protein